MKDVYYYILDLLRQMWRFRWWGALMMWVLGMAGAGFVLLMPNVYEAQARFYVDANSRLRDVVHELGMTPNVNSRVFLVRQALLGRPQVERVAEETNLFEGKPDDMETREALINDMMEDLELSSGRGSEAKNLFTIRYRHTDREKAHAVVENLVNGFIEHVINAKAVDTTLAEEFLDSQLQHYRDLLTETESKLEAFKRTNPGFVIGDNGGTFEQLQQARKDAEQIQRTYVIERDKRNELRRQLQKVDPYAPSDGGPGAEISPLIPGAKTQLAINELEARRAQLLLSFTAEHPDVAGIDQQLVLLRDQLTRELQQEASNRGPDGASRATNPVYIQIQLNLSASNLSLAELESQLKDAQKQVAMLDERLQSAPEIEREYIELTRDYDKWRGLYDEVLDQSERERIGRVGEEQDVVTFNVIEPPQAGLEPVSPPRLLLLVGVFMLSLGAAVGLTFLLDQLNPAFGSEKSLAKLDVPVLGSVSMFVTSETRQRRAMDLLRFAAVTVCFALVYGAVIVGMDAGVELIASMRAKT